ncbi:ATP-binding protein [Acidianus manzaensis]|uniref:AAA domain-containing protein n=1 Tax=Acidianus manzaensis TaxID=282676 RepID=A0A1W6K3C2_9CREN|nr:ATP-binding protein [Acidianus manzaensis]ARM76932.1 hypothetical protein B6F84_13505 [Acidianus manzaensis]
MKFEVKNIGPIKHADLNFDDKVVIIGPNSSGKTVLSRLFYVVTDPFFNFHFEFDPPLKGELIFGKDPFDVKKLMKIIKENKDIIMNKIKSNIYGLINSSWIQENSELITERYKMKLGLDDIEVYDKDLKIEFECREENGIKEAVIILEITSKAFDVGIYPVNSVEGENFVTSNIIMDLLRTYDNRSAFIPTERIGAPLLLSIANEDF